MAARKLSPQQKAARTRAKNKAAAERKRQERNAKRRKAYADQKKDAALKVVRRWGRALDKARALGSGEAWQAFRRAKREKDRVREALGGKRWKRMLSEIAEAAEHIFDADFEES